MAAFTAAVAAGAHAIETDLHLSSDGVVVISHDRTLKRCFGIDEHIRACSWSYLSTIRTLRKPHEPMPRLIDLLHFLARPENAHVWLNLDLKLNNPPEQLVAAVARDLQAVSPSNSVPWDKRVVIGCWNVCFNYTSFWLLVSSASRLLLLCTPNSSPLTRSN